MEGAHWDAGGFLSSPAQLITTVARLATHLPLEAGLWVEGANWDAEGFSSNPAQLIATVARLATHLPLEASLWVVRRPVRPVQDQEDGREAETVISQQRSNPSLPCFSHQTPARTRGVVSECAESHTRTGPRTDPAWPLMASRTSNLWGWSFASAKAAWSPPLPD